MATAFMTKPHEEMQKMRVDRWKTNREMWRNRRHERLLLKCSVAAFHYHYWFFPKLNDREAVSLVGDRGFA